MSITAFTGWSATAASNVDLNGIPLSDSMLANQIDGAFQEMMAQLYANVSTTAQFRANTTGKHLTTDQVWSAGAIVLLTDAATIAVDFSTFLNGQVVLGGNRTLGAPTNLKIGQSGFIVFIQDGTGSRTLTFNSAWKFAYGTDPVLSTTAAARDILFYHVIATGYIFATLVKDVG